jgi:lysozyme
MTALWKSIQSHLGITADGIPGPATAQAVAKALGLHSAVAEARSISPAGLALIKQFEGLELKAYVCPAGKLTIGYGSTGAHVKLGMVITEAQADELLRKDLARFEAAVRALCPITTQGQFDALVSFAFNLGEESLKTSTLRRKHNEGDYAGAAAEFGRWNKARVKGVLTELSGLTKRRTAEAKMYRGLV